MKTIQLQTHDDLTLHGTIYAPMDPKALVVLIHGMGEHFGRYAHLAEFFTQNGYAFAGMDLRGHGRSQGKRGHTPSYEHLMNDIELFISTIQVHFPELPLFIYGHSMGGNLVLNALIRRALPITAAVISAPYLKLAFEPPKWKTVLGKISAKWLPELTQPTGLDTEALSRDPNVILAYNNDPLVHDKITSSFFVNVHFAGPYVLEHAAKIKIPLLLMHGTEDKLTSHGATQELHERIPERSELKLWEGFYHELHNEPEQKELLSFVTEWLEKHLKS
jgi:alpha-beta hydrolase superfamily lysophospholipase